MPLPWPPECIADAVRALILRRRALYIIACGPAGRAPAWKLQ